MRRPLPLVATFTDENPYGSIADFSAQIDWGDGQSSTGVVSAGPGGVFYVLAGHDYGSNEGSGFSSFTVTYNVVVAISDQGGSNATVYSTAIVVPSYVLPT